MDELMPLGALQSVRVLGVCVMPAVAYNLGIGCFLYHSIDMDCILMRVKFEAELSVSVLTNTATPLKNEE
jgi:hypothetical protein